jgi:hypothetical protein
MGAHNAGNDAIQAFKVTLALALDRRNPSVHYYGENWHPLFHARHFFVKNRWKSEIKAPRASGWNTAGRSGFPYLSFPCVLRNSTSPGSHSLNHRHDLKIVRILHPQPRVPHHTPTRCLRLRSSPRHSQLLRRLASQSGPG